MLHELDTASKILLKDSSDVTNIKRIVKRMKILLGVLKQLLNALAISESNVVTKEFNVTYTDTKAEPLRDLTNNMNGKETEIPNNPFLDHIINKGKQILKDRSVLYKTPTKYATPKLAIYQKVPPNKHMGR